MPNFLQFLSPCKDLPKESKMCDNAKNEVAQLQIESDNISLNQDILIKQWDDIESQHVLFQEKIKQDKKHKLTTRLEKLNQSEEFQQKTTDQ